ncbi:MAG: imidazole glycerol phosphate synthase subunit HisH [Lentisphaerota bacterium]|jgi:glutamine amidotransferase
MIAIIDYRAGNLTSVKLAFDALNVETVVTSDPAVIRSCARVVFPGVGAAGSAMRNLADLNLITVLRQVIAAGTPFLGICVGTQVLFDFSEEDGGTAALGLLPGRVRLFSPADRHDKVPHMGWNQVRIVRPHPLLAGVADNTDFYFVHSYYPDPADPAVAIGVTDYAGVTFAAMVGRANLVATQFHVEKSGRPGLRMLKNFSTWDGTDR